MKEDRAVGEWLASLGSDDHVVTCTVAMGEILFGIARLAYGHRRTELTTKARIIFDRLPCEAIPSQAAARYATVKAGQQSRGLSLDENDLWIAATALALDATVVSGDADFRRIEGLPVLVV